MDLLTIIEFVLFKDFTLFVTFIFFIVAINLADPATFNPKILNSLPPLENLNLSSVNSSNPPVELIKTYLSSSNGKKDSSVSAWIVLVAFAVMMTLNSFLIERLDFVKSTEAINFFGSGVYNVLSVDDLKDVPRISKSVGAILDVGRPPSLIFVTVVMPTIVILLRSIILDTFAYVFTLVLVNNVLVKATRSPVFTIARKSMRLLVTVEIPGADPDFGEIVTDPTVRTVETFVSPLKV